MDDHKLYNSQHVLTLDLHRNGLNLYRFIGRWHNLLPKWQPPNWPGVYEASVDITPRYPKYPKSPGSHMVTQWSSLLGNAHYLLNITFWVYSFPIWLVMYGDTLTLSSDICRILPMFYPDKRLLVKSSFFASELSSYIRYLPVFSKLALENAPLMRTSIVFCVPFKKPPKKQEVSSHVWWHRRDPHLPALCGQGSLALSHPVSP